MWTYVKWSFRIFVLLFVLGFLHYTLPQHDVVRITNTYNRLTTVGTENSWAYSVPDSGTQESTSTRDIRFIDTAYPDGDVMVYRNEDTGWIWPPYFKFDSSDLQAQAQSLVSAPGAPRWVVITHYGWRNRFLTIYPNATSIREIPDDRPAGERTTPPEYRIIPWFNIGFLVFLAICWGFLQIVWKQFRQRTVDPTVARVGETWDGIEAGVTRQQGRFRRWLDTWRRKR